MKWAQSEKALKSTWIHKFPKKNSVNILGYTRFFYISSISYQLSIASDVLFCNLFFQSLGRNGNNGAI